MYDQLGSEGYNYAADGNGYSSNVINSNTAVDINSNNEFAPGSQYKTLSIGYSGMFNYLFEDIKNMCKAKGIQFKYHPDTRLHSILWKNKKAHFTVATRDNPWIKSADGTADAEARLKRVLRNDPGMGVIRHADAGYDIAKETLKENGLDYKDRLK